jgi:chromosome segregation ATPase
VLDRFFKKAPAGRRHEVVCEPARDWQSAAQRLEKRVHALEAEGQELSRQSRDKDKQIQALAVSAQGLQRQVDQADAWRAREEADLRKDKERERVFQDDLKRTREALDAEMDARIKLDAEVKSLRAANKEAADNNRGLSARGLDLSRQLEAATAELKQLRADNAVLRKKNEGAQWVSKADHQQLEGLLKKTRRELDEVKARLSQPA